MNYPRQRLSFNPMQPDIICIAQLQFTFSQYRTDTDSALTTILQRQNSLKNSEKKKLLQIPTDKQTTKHYISCAWCCSTEYRLYYV